MEFNEKLQLLRKQRELTQEELAEAIFVSRAAISKWESGRGMPGIDSLRSLARFFGVSIDVLLSGDELLDIAETQNKQKENRFLDLLFGLLDCSAAMLFFLPFFRQYEDGALQVVSLLGLSAVGLYLIIACYAVVIGAVVWGILTLALQNCRGSVWMRCKRIASIGFSSTGVLLFIVSLQPYAAVLLFVFLMIKVLFLAK